MWRWFTYLSYRLYNAIKTFNVTGIAIRVYCSYDRL